MDVSDPTPVISELGLPVSEQTIDTESEHIHRDQVIESRQGISAASETHGEFTLSHSQLESAHEVTPDFDDCTNVNSLNVYAAAPAPLNATYVVSRDQDYSEMGSPNTESTRLSLSFNKSQRNDDQSLYLPRVQAPVPLEEISIADEPPAADMSNDYVAPFTVVVGGSAKGNDLLVETIGYSYNIKRKSETTTSWWCSVRNKKVRCPASYSKGRLFSKGYSQSRP